MILIDAKGLCASRPNRPLFTDVSLTLSTGDRLGVVGINGSGKTTLLNMLGGEIEPEAGIVRRGRGARVGMLSQIAMLPGGPVRDVVGAGWRGAAMLDRLGMAGLGDATSDQLSGGQRKRVALARLLAGDWNALILDEPTNHLDLDAIAFLEDHLASFSGGLILVTHDRHVLDRVTTRVLELDRGVGYVHEASGWHSGSGYAAYLAARAEREEQQASEELSRKNLARLELAWLRRGAPARSTKPRARVEAARAIIDARPLADARRGDLGLALGSQRLGSKGIELHGVGFAWSDRRQVLRPFDLSLEPGDRIGVVGRNGVGKTTLLDLVAGRLDPTAGFVERGRTVSIGYYDQLGRRLDLEQSVRDAVAGDKGAPSVADIGLMRRFWFDGDAQHAPISTLSGGERRRLQLLLTLLEQPNVLLLDEPTNDLDLDTLRAMEDLLESWPGIVVAVSHDRAFLDRTVTEVLAIDDFGSVGFVRGGVGGWLASRAAPGDTTGVAAPADRTDPSRPREGRSRSAGVGRSPSTLRRELGAAERRVGDATRRRDEISRDFAVAGDGDHAMLAELGESLAAAQGELVSAEEQWLQIAREAEAVGLDV